MEIQVHLLIGSILIFVLAAFLAIAQHRERMPAINLRTLRKESGKKERRIYPRYQTSLRIKYKISSSSSRGGISWIRDISRGGARLFVDDPFQTTTFLQIEISLPYDPKPIFAKGSVVWIKEKKNNAGLSFDEVDQRDLNRIIRYIAHKEQMKSL